MSEEQIRDPQAKFLCAVRMKKRSIQRKWMEFGAITNKQSLLLLPYHSMLNHAEKLVQDRRSYFLENETISKSHELPHSTVVDVGSSSPTENE